MEKQPFFGCYLLCSLSPRFKGCTYIGFTVNPRRRIRQHNGEKTSGAWQTKKKRPWEMILCIYGFPSQVSALQFEWAWQHPKESLAVREAAKALKALNGIGGKIRLAYTMLTLPEWRSLNLTVNFFSTQYLTNTKGCPDLPSHMKVLICPMDELPCYQENCVSDDEDDFGKENFNCSNSSDLENSAVNDRTLEDEHTSNKDSHMKEPVQRPLMKPKKKQRLKEKDISYVGLEAGPRDSMPLTSKSYLALEHKDEIERCIQRKYSPISSIISDSQLCMPPMEGSTEIYAHMQMSYSQVNDLTLTGKTILETSHQDKTLVHTENSFSKLCRGSCYTVSGDVDSLSESLVISTSQPNLNIPTNDRLLSDKNDFNDKHGSDKLDIIDFPTIQEYSPASYMSPFSVGKKELCAYSSPLEPFSTRDSSTKTDVTVTAGRMLETNHQDKTLFETETSPSVPCRTSCYTVSGDINYQMEGDLGYSSSESMGIAIPQSDLNFCDNECPISNKHDCNNNHVSDKLDSIEFRSRLEFGPVSDVLPVSVEKGELCACIMPSESLSTGDCLEKNENFFLSPEPSKCPVIMISSTPCDASRVFIDLTESPLS